MPEKSAVPRIRERPGTGAWVYGLHAVEAALANPKRMVLGAYFTENARIKLASTLQAKAGLPITMLSPQELTAMLGEDAVHQGALLKTGALEQPELQDFLQALPGNEPAIVAMLDQVTDPHNVGAVLRSSAAFEVKALILQSRHSPMLSGALAKAASGGLESVPVIETVNLARALTLMKNEGFQSVGFDSAAHTCLETGMLTASRTVFVFGSEESGLRRLVRETCDLVLAIRARGSIQSLNVSNAAAIAFYEASRGR